VPDQPVQAAGIWRGVAALGFFLGSLLIQASIPAVAQAQSPQIPDQPGLSDRIEQYVDRLRALLSTILQGSAPETGSLAQPQPSAPLVTASRPVVREVVDWDEFTGRIDSVETVEVRARVPGYLEKVHFRDGQLVKEGDLLYTIDPRPFERVLETARAELAQARVRAANVAKDVERGKPLLEKGWLSQRVYDERENLLRDANAAIAVAEARVKAAELELSFTRITAPISGRISRSQLTAGNYIAAGGSENSTVLTTIVRQDPVYVYFDIGEYDALKYRRLGQLKEGVTVNVGLPDEQGFPHQAKLDFTDNRLDRGTGTLRLRAVLENKAGLFQPGMFARVRIAGSPSYTAVMIPDEAIGTDQTNKFVYVVDDEGTAIRRWVELGPFIDGLRVVRRGVNPDEWVIVKGVQRARHQEKVAVTREPLQMSAAPSKPVSK